MILKRSLFVSTIMITILTPSGREDCVSFLHLRISSSYLAKLSSLCLSHLLGFNVLETRPAVRAFVGILYLFTNCLRLSNPFLAVSRRRKAEAGRVHSMARTHCSCEATSNKPTWGFHAGR